MSPLVLLLLATVLVQNASARDECSGPVIELSLRSKSTDSSQTPFLVQYGALAGFGTNLSEPLALMQLVISNPPDACGPVTSPVPGAALLVARGNCTFTEKAHAVQLAGARAMLLYDNVPGCVTMGFEPNATKDITLAAISIPYDTGRRLLAAAADPAGGPLLSLRRVQVPLVDTSAVLLWLLAVGTVVAGSIWSGVDYRAGKKAAVEEQDPLLEPSAAKGQDGAEPMELSPAAALGFVVVASGTLLLMYFLLNKVFFYVLLVFFCIASVQSQTALYSAALRRMLPPAKRTATLVLPWLGSCPVATVAVMPLSVMVTVVWAVKRNEPWAWVLQDLQGVALMLLVLRSLRVPSLKVAAILLPACLAYDVFWVFIQPLLFGGGQSVMVEVAQGGSSGEYIPMLLRVPHFGLGELGGQSLLGFGDVILPGLLVALMQRLDLDMGLDGAFVKQRPLLYIKMSYFPYTAASYGAGLCLTYAALAFSWFGDQGQPALLYLVPCTLLTVSGLGAVRGQLGRLWRGDMCGASGARRQGEHESDPGGDVGQTSDLGMIGNAGGAGGDVEEGGLLGRERGAQSGPGSRGGAW